ncbi:MAG TPA: YggT family protein [Pseudomonadales bacterium]
MSSGQQALVFLVQSLFQLYLVIVLLRFLLQLARADFFNPVSQAIVKATAPLLNPLRRIIPGIGGVDIASLVLAVLLYLVMILLVAYLIIGQFINPLSVLLGSLVGVLNLIISIYFFAIIISAISSWIPPLHGHPITRLVWQLVEPLLGPFRKLLPDLGGIDLSPILALMALKVVQILIQPLLVL